MPSEHENFWYTIETRPDQAALPIEWRNFLGDQLKHLDSYLIPTNEHPYYYPDPKDKFALRWRLFPLPDGNFKAESRNQDDHIILTPDEAFNQRWDIKAFSKSLISILKLQPTSQVNIYRDNVIRLGNIRITGSYEYPVFLVLSRRPKDLINDVSWLLASKSSQFIVLTGTRRIWDGEFFDTMKQHNIHFVAMNDVLTIADGKFIPTPVWDDAIAAFKQAVLPEDSYKYVFAKRGSWIFRFGNNETVLDGNNSGPAFVQFLIQNAGIEFHVEKLWHLVMGSPDEGNFAQIEQLLAEEGDIAPNGLLTGADNILDPMAKKEYEQRLKKLTVERTKALKEKCGQDILAQIDSEFAFIKKALKGACPVTYKPKKLGDPIIILRDRIRRAINSFIYHVSSHDPAGGQFLKNTIKKGIFMKFLPCEKNDWIFS
ncbi:MAG: hypothetical protein ACRC2T_12000 [Thermoguttaceae bacterium]